MPTTIKLKNGSGAPLAGDLVQGEPALDLTNKRLYTEDSGGNVIEVGTNPSTIDINAGSIDGVTLGTNSPVTSAVITTADINGGTIDGVTIGGASAGAGTFTTLQADTSLNVDGTVTADGLTVDGTADVDNLIIDNSGKISSVGQIELQVDTDNNQSGTYIGFSRNNTTSERLALFSENGDISFYEDTGTTPKLFWDASAESLGIGTSSPSASLHIANKNSSGSSTAPNFRTFAFDPDSYYEINQDGNNSILVRIYNSASTLVYNFAAHSGNLTITGALSKGSGSFKIDHPIKPETHHLVHSFVEAPQADNIYRGKVDLVDGTATVNIDTVAGMTEGTFDALNREVQCFTSNESGWTAVRGSVYGNILTIEAQDNTCADTISWMVVGERKDKHMYDTDWTDENGKVIVEPEKVIEDGESE